MNIKPLPLCWCVALWSAVLPESITAGNLLQCLQCLFLKIILAILKKIETFHFEGGRAGQLFQMLLQHVKVTNHLDLIFASLLASRLPSCGGSMTLDRPGVAFPAGFPH